jgi:DNA repair protein RecO (recombination protein O)
MVFSTDALVLRSLDTGDYDRLLTLLTPEHGRISALAKGVRSPRSKFAAASQPYVYGNYEIYRKNDMNWLRAGTVTEYFKGLREDIEKLSLAAYLSDIAAEVTGEYVPAVDILRMTLNTFYALDKNIRPASEIKAVYEWRAAGYAGYMPDLECCGICRVEAGNENCEVMYLDVMNGRLICPACLKVMPHKAMDKHFAEENVDGKYIDGSEYERSILIPMGAGAVAASRYALSSLPERMFSFRIKDMSDRDEFCRAGEVYLLNHLERGFDSLNFYKTLIK